MDWDLSCQNCGTHYVLSPGDNLNGAVTDGMACEQCGGKRFFRNQPSPTQSDGTLRNMVDSDTQIDQGGNPLGEGTIMGTDGERPFDKRDNFMHSHTAGFNYEDYPGPDEEPPEHSYEHCPVCGSEGGIEPSTNPKIPYWSCINCGTKFEAPRVPHPDQFQHPDPIADNSPGSLTIPQHWGHKSVAVDRSLDMEPYEMDGLFDLPTSYRHLGHQIESGFLAPLIPEVAPVVAEGLGAAATDLGLTGAGAAAEGGAAAAGEAGAAAATEGAGAAEQAGQSLVQKGLDMAKSKGMSTLKNQAMNQIKQRLPGGGISGLMKGALGFGAGGAAGVGAAGGSGSVPGSPGAAPPGASDAGWQTTQPGQWYGSYTLPMILVADLETSDSVKSVGEQNGDDPEKVDQKEFNDRDKNPSNHKNPNNEDSGASGEDGVREKTEGYGFGPNSPAIDRAMMMLPLILHYFQSEESGENDPLIKGLHDMLESENPGYLQQQHPDGHQIVQEIIQLHKPHPGEEQQHAHQAGFANPFDPQQATDPGPQINQPVTRPMGTPQIGSRCPQCNGVTNPDGSCPQCGQAAQQPGMVSMPNRVGNTVGPQTPEQKSVVIQYLVDHGRGDEAPNVDLHPEQYAKELAEITRQPNVPPQPDPSQITPLVPQPSNPGAMPMPDPGASAGPASGAPLQPMSAVDALVWPLERLHTADTVAPRCPECGSGSTSLRQSGGDDGITAECAACHTIFDVADNIDANKYKGAKVAADGVAPRCPFCGSGTTGLRQSAGDDGTTAECNACHKIWDVSDNVDVNKYKGAAYVGPAQFPSPHGVNDIQMHVTPYGEAEAYDANLSPRDPRHSVPIGGDDPLGTLMMQGIPAGPSGGPLPGINQRLEENGFNWGDYMPIHQGFHIEGLVDVPNPHMQPVHDGNGMAWKDTTGNDLQENQEYEISSAAFGAPTYARIIKVHPNHIDLKISGGVAASLNPDQNTPDFTIQRKEAQLDDYQFTPVNTGGDMDDHNTEPPQGGTMPGVEHIPDQAPTTDELASSFPNTTVSSVEDEDVEEPEEPDHCVKCGSAMLDSSMRDEYTTLYQCVPCGHAWEIRDNFQGKESGVDLSWLRSSDGQGDDFWGGYERAQAMREAGTESRNLSDIVARDDRYQKIHETLAANAMQREAGKHFTPSEKRALINERGRARNLEDLDLTNTHYDIREDLGKANGLNVREDDLFLGI